MKTIIFVGRLSEKVYNILTTLTVKYNLSKVEVVEIAIKLLKEKTDEQT